MKKVILFLFFTSQLVAQKIKDFNYDNVNDTLVNYYRRYVLTNGKTGQKFDIVNEEGGSGSRIDFIGIPDKLFLKENKSFLEGIKKELLPEKSLMDGSLKWLISAGVSAKRIEYNNKTPLFNAIFYPKTKWKAKLSIPKSYYIEVSKDTFKMLRNDYEYLEYDPDKVLLKYFLYYYPSYQEFKDEKRVIQDKTYQVFKTRHSIFVKKQNRYKWLFFSDSSITGGVQKLRWESIRKIALVDHYLIIHQAATPDNSYDIQIINIENQRVGRLNFDATYKIENGMDTFEIIEKKLIFTDRFNGLNKIPLQKIFETLDK